jgi:hypothetical protein
MILNNEYKRMQKEMVIAFNRQFRHLPDENVKNLSRTAVLQADNQLPDLLNM